MCYSRTVRSVFSAAAVALLVVLAGCRGETPEQLVPVTGRVTVKGKPLPAGIAVIFYPDAHKGNTTKLEPRGQLDAQGVYRLYSSHSGDREGAPLGWYQVAVFAIKPTREMRPPEWLANQRYSDPKASGLEVQVVDDDGTYDFDLKP